MHFTRFLAVAAALVVASSSTASAATSKLESARRAARETRERLAQVSKQVETQASRSAAARQSAAAARSRLRRAQSEEATVERRLAQVREATKDIALRAYVRGVPGTRTASAADPATFARAEFLRASVIGTRSDIADALSAAREDLEAKRKAADAAARLAASRQRAASDLLASLRGSQAQQLRLVAAAEARYNASLRESVALARRSPVRRSGNISLTTVRGITVASEIAGRLESMLNAADGDGVRFGGSGYRSSDGQVAARRRNCGSSDYDVYEKPASRCSPPTARPGQSMHDQGLAIDFTYNGSVISSRNNPGFQWLSRNAGRFGFYNLPSEPWHWSTNGN